MKCKPTTKIKFLFYCRGYYLKNAYFCESHSSDIFMERIFISYKREDKQRVFELKDYIEKETKIPCWIDIDGIESDAQFANVIINAINQSEVFLFMYSHSHTLITNYENDWSIREINFAQRKGKRIVFINIDGTPLTDWFSLIFGTKQQVDGQSTKEMSKLVKDINQWLINDNRIISPQYNIFNLDNSTRTPQKIEKKQFRLFGLSFNMIRIQRGSFFMGTVVPYTNQEVTIDFKEDIPGSHPVILTKDYYIGEVPVTQRFWSLVMNDNPSRFINDDNPVDSVSWNSCQDFIERLNFMMGVKFRLPSESEWEFAARGGIMSHNYRYSGSNKLEDVAWYKDNSHFTTHPVKEKRANELGLFDMSGNVWEWCIDYYSDFVRDVQYDPIGPPNGIHHVYKGGCWCEDEDCRVTMRRAGLPDFSSYGGLGFRLAMTL